MKLIKHPRSLCTFQMTEAEFHQLQADDTGLCTNCGETRGDCEPDARDYPCESCKRATVYGTDALLEAELIEIRS